MVHGTLFLIWIMVTLVIDKLEATPGPYMKREEDDDHTFNEKIHATSHIGISEKKENLNLPFDIICIRQTFVIIHKNSRIHHMKIYFLLSRAFSFVYF